MFEWWCIRVQRQRGPGRRMRCYHGGKPSRIAFWIIIGKCFLCVGNSGVLRREHTLQLVCFFCRVFLNPSNSTFENFKFMIFYRLSQSFFLQTPFCELTAISMENPREGGTAITRKSVGKQLYFSLTNAKSKRKLSELCGD